MNASETKLSTGKSKRWVVVGSAVVGIIVVGWVVWGFFSRPCSVSVTPACIELDDGLDTAWATVRVKTGQRTFRFFDRCREWKVSALPDWLRAERIEDRRGPNLKLTFNRRFQDEIPAIGFQGKLCLDWPSRGSRYDLPCRAGLTVSRLPPDLQTVFWHEEEPEEGEEEDPLKLRFDETEPAVVAAGGDGGFLAVWAQEGARGGHGGGGVDDAVVARTVDGTGQLSDRLVLQGAEEEDDTEADGKGDDQGGGGFYFKPGVAGDGSGTYLVAWSAEEGSGFVIVAGVDIASNGQPTLLDDQEVDAEEGCSAEDTTVAYDPGSQQWVVLWDLDGGCSEANEGEALSHQIEWAFVGSNEDIGADLPTHTYQSNQNADQTAAIPDPVHGGFLVAWADEEPESDAPEAPATPTRVRIARLAANGETLTEVTPVSEDSDGVASSSPALACGPPGNAQTCLLLWSSSPLGTELFQKVHGRFLRLAQEGATLKQQMGDPFVVAEADAGARLLAPGVAWQHAGGDDGRFLTVWSRETGDGSQVLMQWIGTERPGRQSPEEVVVASSVPGWHSTRAEIPNFLSCPPEVGPCLLLWKHAVTCEAEEAWPPVKILGTFLPPPAP